MRHLACIAVVVLYTFPLVASTYYLDAAGGSDTDGNGSAGGPWQTFGKAQDAVQPGDSVLLAPGVYGTLTVDRGYGGSGGGYVTWMADPVTCAPRADNWYEDTLAAPDPGERPVLNGIFFQSNGDEGTADGHYTEINGLDIVGGNIYFRMYVASVRVTGCNIFGSWGEVDAAVTDAAFYFYHSLSSGSQFRDILIEDCYVTTCGKIAMLKGNYTGSVAFRGCHSYHTSSGGISLHGAGRITIDGNHIEYQEPLPADHKHTVSVVSVAGDRTFSVSDGLTYYDFAVFYNPQEGSRVIRAVEAFDGTSLTVSLAAAPGFSLTAGDTVQFWDAAHGSGISLWRGDVAVINNRIHNIGSTRAIYAYAASLDDVTIENNLIYSAINQYTVDLAAGDGGIGDNFIIRNNTIAGTKHRNYDSGDASLLYGFALRSEVDADDPSTVVIANNVFVGTAEAGGTPGDAVIRNNIAYASATLEEDASGANQGNLVYYGGEPVGSEPQPFHTAGGFFIGGYGFDAGLEEQHAGNFNEYFRLAEGADAIGFADPAYATAADMVGRLRDAHPAAGCYEWTGSSIGYSAPADPQSRLLLPNPVKLRELLDSGIIGAWRIFDTAGRTVSVQEISTAGVFLLKNRKTGAIGSVVMVK